jgi:catechol 2,3-dioxygenase-like lactoylglutathione lyase family enzyme
VTEEAAGVDKSRQPVNTQCMSKRLFDHIDLRVRNREIAQRFYAQVLPAIGFKADKSDEEYGQFQPAGKTPVEFFCFQEEADHKPNANRIAFWAESRAAVDKVAEVVRKAGGKNVEGPELCVDYSPGYYAVFFEDPDGNKLEVCCRESGLSPQ